jgi:hypothetical protein
MRSRNTTLPRQKIHVTPLAKGSLPKADPDELIVDSERYWMTDYRSVYGERETKRHNRDDR